MIDLKEYTLVFWRKEDGKKFIGRRVCEGHYVLRDPENPDEGHGKTKSKLWHEFISDRENGRSPVKKQGKKNLRKTG